MYVDCVFGTARGDDPCIGNLGYLFVLVHVLYNTYLLGLFSADHRYEF